MRSHTYHSRHSYRRRPIAPTFLFGAAAAQGTEVMRVAMSLRTATPAPSFLRKSPRLSTSAKMSISRSRTSTAEFSAANWRRSISYLAGRIQGVVSLAISLYTGLRT